MMQEQLRLGKLLKVGDTFKTTTKCMMKNRQRYSTMDKVTRRKLMTYEVLKPGTVRTFQKGNRMYVCEVLGIVEMRTGCYVFEPRGWNKFGANLAAKFNQWWQFTYMVRILEN